MKKNKRKSFNRVVSVFALVLMLCLSISVSAEMFSAGEAGTASGFFSAGEAGELPGSDISGETAGNIVEGIPGDTAGDIAADMPGDVSGSVTEDITGPEDGNVSEDIETPSEDGIISGEISVDMNGTTTLPGTGQGITLVFMNQAGGIYNELQVTKKLGDTIVLPIVPGRENAAGSGWKVELAVADTAAKVWESGTTLTISDSDFYLADKIQNAVLKFYAVPGVDPCIVTYYTGDGQKILQRTEVKKGTEIVFPDFQEDGYKNYGWAPAVNALAPTYLIGSSYQVQSDVNFYLVRTEMVSATFKKRTGSQNAIFRAFDKTVESGTTIILPEVPEVAGYQSLGWAHQTYANEAVYTAGQTVVLNDDTTFYAVYKYLGKRTVKFSNNSGTTTSKRFTSLNKKVTRYTYLTLPAVPEVSGYKALGWSVVKKATVARYKPGDSIKVSKNVTFYAVYQKICKVYLRTKGGKLWKTVEVPKGTYYELPGVTNKDGYTMMGWSNKKGQSRNAKYEVGEKIKITKNTTLYSVLFVRTNETDYSGTAIQKYTSGITKKYKQIIFVGDSRTVRMELTLEKSGYSAKKDKISFIAQNGQGLSWLKSTAYPQLLNKIGTGSLQNEKPIAVVFNLGVNDLKNSYKYISYMKSIAPELKALGCELYYMSVNPVNNASITYWGKKDRPEATVRLFNTRIKAQLCGSSGDYTYIDTYSYLQKYGYGTNAGSQGYDIKKDDGLHFTVKTYKRIFRYCINFLK